MTTISQICPEFTIACVQVYRYSEEKWDNHGAPKKTTQPTCLWYNEAQSWFVHTYLVIKMNTNHLYLVGCSGDVKELKPDLSTAR